MRLVDTDFQKGTFTGIPFRRSKFFHFNVVIRKFPDAHSTSTSVRSLLSWINKRCVLVLYCTTKSLQAGFLKSLSVLIFLILTRFGLIDQKKSLATQLKARFGAMGRWARRFAALQRHSIFLCSRANRPKNTRPVYRIHYPFLLKLFWSLLLLNTSFPS